MERADFKLGEITSRIGPASYIEVFRSTNTAIERLYLGQRAKISNDLPGYEDLDVKFIESIKDPRLGTRIWVF